MSLKFSPISWKQSTMLDIHKIDIQETPSLLSDMMLWSYSSAEAAPKLVLKNNISGVNYWRYKTVQCFK